MSGVELIVAALAAGATSGVAAATGSAIEDAYVGLKRLLARRLTGRPGAVEALDTDEADPGAWRARLYEDLAASRADTDQEILTAARRLLALTGAGAGAANTYLVDLRDARGVQLGEHNTQTNTFG